jgi:hypothetical protein
MGKGGGRSDEGGGGGERAGDLGILLRVWRVSVARMNSQHQHSNQLVLPSVGGVGLHSTLFAH